MPSTGKADADREVAVLDGMSHEAQPQHAGMFQRPGHRQRPSIHRAQSEAFDECRNACLRLRVVPGDKHVQWVGVDWTGRQDVGVLGVEALTMTALAGATRAISFAPNVSGDVRKPERSDLMGLVISTRILPASFSPYCLTTSRTAE